MKGSYIVMDTNPLRRLIRRVGLRFGFSKRVLRDIESEAGSPDRISGHAVFKRP